MSYFSNSVLLAVVYSVISMLTKDGQDGNEIIKVRRLPSHREVIHSLVVISGQCCHTKKSFRVFELFQSGVTMQRSVRVCGLFQGGVTTQRGHWQLLVLEGAVTTDTKSNLSVSLEDRKRTTLIQTWSLYLVQLSLIHIWRCRRAYACRSRWSPDH